MNEMIVIEIVKYNNIVPIPGYQHDSLEKLFYCWNFKLYNSARNTYW